MAMLVLGLAALTVPLSGANGSPDTRFDRAGSAETLIQARIIRAASVGPGRGPPVPRMVPRRTTVAATDGRLVAALIYDLE